MSTQINNTTASRIQQQLEKGLQRIGITAAVKAYNKQHFIDGFIQVITKLNLQPANTGPMFHEKWPNAPVYIHGPSGLFFSPGYEYDNLSWHFVLIKKTGFENISRIPIIFFLKNSLERIDVLLGVKPGVGHIRFVK